MSNKKGAWDMSDYVGYLMFMSIPLIVGTLIIIVGFMIASSNTTHGIFDDLLIKLNEEKALYSGSCFAYQSNDRTYSGVIDYDKFTPDTVRNCFEQGDSPGILFRLTYEDKDTMLGKKFVERTTSAYYSSTNTRVAVNTYPVIVRKDNKEYRGTMTFYHKY